MTIAVFLTVVIAGAIGAVLRYGIATALVRRPDFPFAVLLVNTVGSAVAGAALGLAEVGAMTADLRLIILTGFCGGLTTFSTFSVESIELALAGRWRIAVLSIVGNLVLGIGAAGAAYAVTLLVAR